MVSPFSSRARSIFNNNRGGANSFARRRALVYKNTRTRLSRGRLSIVSGINHNGVYRLRWRRLRVGIFYPKRGQDRAFAPFHDLGVGRNSRDRLEDAKPCTTRWSGVMLEPFT